MKTKSKNKLILLINTIVCALIFLSSCNTKQNSWIRYNQLGYLPVSIKKAVYFSHTNDKIRKFCLRDPKTDKIVWKSDNVEKYDGNTVFSSVYYLDFTEMRDTGTFYLETGGCESGSFRNEKLCVYCRWKVQVSSSSTGNLLTFCRYAQLSKAHLRGNNYKRRKINGYQRELRGIPDPRRNYGDR